MNSRMKIALNVTAVIVMLPLVVGMLLPSKRVFTKTAKLKSSPQQVWDVITNVKAQKEWRDDVKSIEMISSEKGAEKWTETPKKGQPITFQVKTFQEPNRYDIEIVDSGISGYWEGRITESNGTTSVAFKEIIDVKNPYFRTIVYLFVDLDKTMDIYMTNLKKKLGEQ